MTHLRKIQLISAAEELNEIPLKPPIDTTLTNNEIIKQLTEAVGILEATDEFSSTTLLVLCDIGCREQLESIGLVEPKKEEEPEEVNADDLESDEATEEPEPEDDFDPVDLTEEEPDKIPEKKAEAVEEFKPEPEKKEELEEKKPFTIDDIPMDELVKKLEKRGIGAKPRRKIRKLGEISAHEVALEIMCKEPDLTLYDLLGRLKDKDFDDTDMPSIRTAHYNVNRIVTKLRANGLIK